MEGAINSVEGLIPRTFVADSPPEGATLKTRA